MAVCETAVLCKRLYTLDCLQSNVFLLPCQELALSRSFLAWMVPMIKLKIPELMKSKGATPTDLMRHANIAYGTALRLSKGEAEAISFEVLDNLCTYFDVRVQDILEYVPSKSK